MDKTPIGFDRQIQVEWLDQTAELVLSGKSSVQIRASLDNLLASKLSGGKNDKTDSGSSRGKTLAILTKIWISPPSRLSNLHRDGLELLNQLPYSEHLPIHWGMSMAVYPFFGQVADTVGKLLRLQDTVNLTQVQRRIREQMGESETVSRATRRVVRSFVDWGVLSDTGNQGTYKAATPATISDNKIMAWLLEALLISNDSKTGLLKMLTEAPSLYPFKFVNPITTVNLETNPRLEFYYQGVDQNLVSLRSY